MSFRSEYKFPFLEENRHLKIHRITILSLNLHWSDDWSGVLRNGWRLCELGNRELRMISNA
jgi:hypothetical protein